MVAAGHYNGHSYPGIGAVDMDYFQAQTLHTNVTYGSLIDEVVAGGPADKAGVHVNDIIVGINGTCLENSDALSSYLQKYTLPNENVTLNIVRNNQNLNLPLTLGTRPPPPS